MRDAVGIRRGKVDLVEHGDDLEIRIHREVGIRERLCLDALGGIHDEDCTLAGVQGPRHLVREVDVTRRVDQIQDIFLAVSRRPAHACGLGLDRDPPLTLQIHLVEELGAHLPGGERLGGLEQAIGERALPMIDVSDDAEIADAAGIGHALTLASLESASTK